MLLMPFHGVRLYWNAAASLLSLSIVVVVVEALFVVHSAAASTLKRRVSEQRHSLECNIVRRDAISRPISELRCVPSRLRGDLLCTVHTPSANRSFDGRIPPASGLIDSGNICNGNGEQHAAMRSDLQLVAPRCRPYAMNSSYHKNNLAVLSLVIRRIVLGKLNNSFVITLLKIPQLNSASDKWSITGRKGRTSLLMGHICNCFDTTLWWLYLCYNSLAPSFFVS